MPPLQVCAEVARLRVAEVGEGAHLDERRGVRAASELRLLDSKQSAYSPYTEVSQKSPGIELNVNVSPSKVAEGCRGLAHPAEGVCCFNIAILKHGMRRLKCSHTY